MFVYFIIAGSSTAELQAPGSEEQLQALAFIDTSVSMYYSKKNDVVYCFCCKLFSRKSKELSTEGQRDWVNVGALLKQHENSPGHCNNMVKWKDFALCLSKQKTIDATDY